MRPIKPLPERKKHVACTNMDSIKALALDLMKKNQVGTASNDMAAEIYTKIILLKEQVIAMEKRLYLYKETIEGLGFKRVRR